MSNTVPEQTNTNRTLAIIAGLVAFVAIALLTFNVSKEISLLSSARSDNMQWSLAQTEVEFLDFSARLGEVDPDLVEVRRKYDVFFSRINIVQTASVFSNLRSDVIVKEQLLKVQSFLDTSVKVIDSDDAVLRTQIPRLREMSEAIRPDVRRLANAGLEQFAFAADTQRQAVARTMTELAIALTALIAALAFLVYYLSQLNRRTMARELEQKRTTTRMNTVMSTSLDGVIVGNADGKIIQFSPAAEKIFGHASEDVIGKDIGEVIIPDNLRSAHDRGMERARNGGEKRVVGAGRVMIEAKRSDGELFPVELAIESAVTDEGEIYIAFLRDVSKVVADKAELVAARDMAVAGEKLKTDFLATMSHEIRTPLNGLLGSMDLLKDTSLSATQERYLRNMDTSGRLLMSHISDVLDITRYDAGKLDTRSEPVDVSALLQDIIDSQSSMAAANETSLDWGWDGPSENWINSDHKRLQHILMNLIGNAVKFTKRGKVSLTALAGRDGNNHNITFEISDTGPGISEELAERIFDDFVTGNTAYDRDVGGTGLGLSIAKRFVNALDGKIWLESTEGEGSRFFVQLPVTLAEPVMKVEGENHQSKISETLSVLLVEDNEINRIVAREMLEADGHIVTEAHDGQQGVQVAQSESFDLILMDISMPVMDGRAATRAIRSGHGPSAQTKIVALTANAMPDEQESFKTDGMNGTLTKPLTKAALRHVMHDVRSDVPADVQVFVDLKHNSETRDAVGEDAYGQLFSRFATEAEGLIVWLRSSDKNDVSDIVSRVHKVAGSAAVFGAVEFRKQLKEIEDCAKAGPDVEINMLIEQLPKVWEKSKVYFG